jgi:predicted transposase YbfD/YdcC
MANSSLKTPNNFPVFHSFFTSLVDPRRTNKGNFFYPLEEILLLTISAVISGADGWTSISKFGEEKLEWLQKYYQYENGTPSHDILGDLFARLDHREFAQCFTNWVGSICSRTNGEIVAIDGKTICKSGDYLSNKSALHVVSAYASVNRLCLGQQVVDEKSNEITAIPELLKILDIKGCIVTIDAMGCQKKIAQEIIKQEADYMLMVKNNQPELKRQVEKLFKRGDSIQKDKQVDAGHGRVETRICDVVDDLRFMDDRQYWEGLKSIVRVQAERYDKKTKNTSHETRYYISSLDADAKISNDAVRKHWSIENNLHWTLDVVFKEDSSLKKNGNSAINYNIILKLALAMIEKEQSQKQSKPLKRLHAAWSDKYRNKILKC